MEPGGLPGLLGAGLLGAGLVGAGLLGGGLAEDFVGLVGFAILYLTTHIVSYLKS
jgi:hypothetical protein